jgi:hypothetical protein
MICSIRELVTRCRLHNIVSMWISPRYPSCTTLDAAILGEPLVLEPQTVRRSHQSATAWMQAALQL